MCYTWGQYHGGQRQSSDDSFHSPTVIPLSALDKLSIIKRYHHRQTTRWGVIACSPTMVTLHGTRIVEGWWWNVGWTDTWRSSASMIPAPGLRMRAPRPLEHTCWRHFAVQSGDCQKFQTAPFNVTIVSLTYYSDKNVTLIFFFSPPVSHLNILSILKREDDVHTLILLSCGAQNLNSATMTHNTQTLLSHFWTGTNITYNLYSELSLGMTLRQYTAKLNRKGQDLNAAILQTLIPYCPVARHSSSSAFDVMTVLNPQAGGC